MNELAQTLAELERVREVASWHDRDKFLKAFFKARNIFRTDLECFEYLNDQFYDLTGKERYEWESFKVIKNLR